MRKKTATRRGSLTQLPRIPEKPRASSCSKDPTFTPFPTLLLSPPCADPMARTKITPRYPSSSKPLAPQSTPFCPSTSKGKRPAVEEPTSEPSRPKPRPTPQHPQRVKSHTPLRSVKESQNVDPFEHKSHFMNSHSNYNPHGRELVLYNESIGDSLEYTDVGACAYTSGGGSVKQQKNGATRTEKIVIDDDDDDDDELDDIPPPSTSETSALTGHKSLLYGVVKDFLQKFVNLSNHLISTSQQQRKLAMKNENALRKSRDRVAVLLKYVDNINEDDTMVTDQEEPLDSEEDGSNARGCP
ncbi:uncharacterized protein LOC110272120 [Arachis ipaensis]|uniref:uncharacterized protein LOC110272120 n=1 Tax=Arachis ipaensis TaxID=130454 RepID=UPI000A2B2804|nr:uncharacterized protein LOC110272120 [Arachis ipaensis]XP_025653120.1 uncharacterized protein LOC112749067 [Arachis hypogaea]